MLQYEMLQCYTYSDMSDNTQVIWFRQTFRVFTYVSRSAVCFSLEFRFHSIYFSELENDIINYLIQLILQHQYIVIEKLKLSPHVECRYMIHVGCCCGKFVQNTNARHWVETESTEMELYALEWYRIQCFLMLWEKL